MDLEGPGREVRRTKSVTVGSTTSHSRARRSSLLLRLGTTLGAAFLFLLLSIPSASAHSVLARSDPADGASLRESPERILLWFDEPLRLELSSFSLASLDGEPVDLTTIRGTGPQGTVVDLEFPTLAHGVYSLAWEVLSVTDTHVTSGVLLFGVGEEVASIPPTPQSSAPVDPLEVGLRWLDLLSLATLVGATTVAGIVLKTSRGAAADRLSRDARKRALTMSAAAAAMAFAIGVGLLVWQIAGVPSTSAGGSSRWIAGPRLLLLRGRWAALWWARQVILAALLVATVSLRRRIARGDVRTAPAWALAGVLVASVTLVRALGGHAASLPSGTPSAIVANAVHVLAAGVWIGGLVSLAVVTLPLVRTPGVAPFLAGTWRRFGIVAALSLGVLAATGLYEAGRQVASSDAALRTTYGHAAIGKVVLGLLVGAIGLANAITLRPSLLDPIRRALRRPVRRGPVSTRRLRMLVTVEASLGAAGLLLLAAVMGSVAPARGPAFAAHAPTRTSATAQSHDLLLTLSVKPNLPGRNLVTLTAISTRRPAPGVVKNVQLTVGGTDGTTQRLERIAQTDAYRLGWEVDQPGRVPMTVTVRREGLDDETGSFNWVVGDGRPTRSAVFSTRPLAPALTWAAAVVLVVTGLGGGWIWLGKRRSKADDDEDGAPSEATADRVPGPVSSSNVAPSSDGETAHAFVGSRGHAP